MKKTLTVTLSSIAAFIAINTAANAQESETSQLDSYATSDVITNQSNLGIYTVKPGDSLYKIALEHHLTLEELYALNPGIEPLIFPGDEIVVSETAFEQFNNTNTFVNYETNYIPVGYIMYQLIHQTLLMIIITVNQLIHTLCQTPTMV